MVAIKPCLYSCKSCMQVRACSISDNVSHVQHSLPHPPAEPGAMIAVPATAWRIWPWDSSWHRPHRTCLSCLCFFLSWKVSGWMYPGSCKLCVCRAVPQP